MIIVLILICASILLIFHSYLLYPWFLSILPKNSSDWNHSLQKYSVAVLIAAYNEETVIEDKIMSVLNNVPKGVDLDIYVGSDASTDRTGEIVELISKIHPNVHLETFAGRTGKAAIINSLSKDKNHDIFILTDANVLFSSNTILELLKPFQEPKVALVCANILKIPVGKSSFESLEKSYIERENRIKQMESDLWKIVIGAEGGCYAIRRNEYEDIPKNFFMDDFFMTMQVIEKRKYVIFQKNAVCHEYIPSLAKEEFKRKTRISTGNFQNLYRFKNLLSPSRGAVSFAFMSHKVLRWHTPLFLLVMLLSSGYLCFYSLNLLPFFIVQFLLLFSPLFSVSKIPILSPLIHFYSMNIALFIGLILYLKGVRSSIWEPTSRMK